MKTIVIDAGHGGNDPGAKSFDGKRFEKNDNLKMAQLVAARLRECGQRVVMTRNSDVFIGLTDRAAISNSAGADIFVSFHRNAYTNPQANGVETFVYTNASPNSWKYADIVQNNIVDVGVQTDRGVKSANYSVLRNTKAPAILLELGFITNTADNALFDKNAASYADAIANGILKSLGETCGSGGGTPQMPTVRRGSRGDSVKLLQTLLREAGFNIAADGIFGPKTELAVRQYQTQHGLVPDGIVGKNTWGALL